MGPIDGRLPLALPRVENDLEPGIRPPSAEGQVGFAEVLEGIVQSANTRALEASHAAEEFSAGRRDDIHGTMLALSQAEIELKFAGNVRNKIIDAFYELWRMQI
ncbi:MAG TPA: flagellar hook-basal body complex protein FliE [Polyangiaceae bacterium]|nr:flagellar hook-basal body complex protein FliE [Polyangiaceae bacterium]